MSIFRHADGRVMKRTQAGGLGGGVTSRFDELASADEVAEFEALEHEPVVVEPVEIESPEPSAEGEIRPAEAAPNA